MDIERIRAVISELTAEEKAALCGCGISLVSAPVARLRIKTVTLPPQLFSRPPLSAIGCSFSTELASEYGAILGAEAIVDGAALAGPLNIGVIRSPMDAGSETMFSEDAYVTATLADAVADGSPVKLLCRGALGGEYPFDQRWMDMRALRERYLLPLKKVGKKLGGLMIDGGSLNGDLVAQSPRCIALLCEYLSSLCMLVNEPGSVVSVPAAVAAGACYLPSVSAADISAVYNAVKDGKLNEKRLDLNLERLIELVCEYNEKKSIADAPTLSEDFDERLCLASTVLIKNEGALPVPQGSAAGVIGDISKQDALRMSDLSVTYKKTDEPRTLIFLRLDGEEYTREQTLLVKKTAAGGSQPIVILIAQRPAPLPFFDDAKAIFYAPYDCAKLPDCIARTVVGKHNPCGKLNVTYARAKEQYPAYAYKKAAGRGMFCYESVLCGHTYFTQFNVPPLLPFGHGLSYTSFEISKLRAEVNGDVLRVEYVVKNVGMMNGSATTFAFGTLPYDNIMGLRGRLYAFKTVYLEKSENILVHHDVNLNDFAVYDEGGNEWLIPGGKLEISVGMSAGDKRASCTVRLPRSTRYSAGASKKDAPSYYGEKGFQPLGSEVERVLQTPLINNGYAFGAFTFRTDDAARKKKIKALGKKLARQQAADVSATQSYCESLSDYALGRLSD